MKIITDLHFLSPSGCTFWGKKPWSRKKKLFWQIGTIFGAPVGIGLLACIAVPAMVIGIPIWVGRKIHSKLKTSKKHKRNISIFGAVLASVSSYFKIIKIEKETYFNYERSATPGIL